MLTNTSHLLTTTFGSLNSHWYHSLYFAEGAYRDTQQQGRLLEGEDIVRLLAVYSFYVIVSFLIWAELLF